MTERSEAAKAAYPHTPGVGTINYEQDLRREAFDHRQTVTREALIRVLDSVEHPWFTGENTDRPRALADEADAILAADIFDNGHEAAAKALEDAADALETLSPTQHLGGWEAEWLRLRAKVARESG